MTPYLTNYRSGDLINKKPILLGQYPKKKPLVSHRWQRAKLKQLIARIEGKS